MSAPGRHRLVTLACTAGALTGFAANSLLTRAAVGPALIDAVTFTSVRLLAGALALGGLVHVMAATRSAPRRSQASPWMGAGALAGYAYAFAFAYTRIDAGTGALLLFGAVQLTMTGWGIACGERPRVAEWLGFGVALAGLIVLTRPGQHAPDPLGAVLMAAAGVCWGVYSLLGRQADAPLPRTFTNFALAAGAGALRPGAPAGAAHHDTGSPAGGHLGIRGVGPGLHAVVPGRAGPVAISCRAGAVVGAGRDRRRRVAAAGRAHYGAVAVVRAS